MTSENFQQQQTSTHDISNNNNHTTDTNTEIHSDITADHIAQITTYLKQLQVDICSALEYQEHQGGIDGASTQSFVPDDWERIKQGKKQGGGRSCILSDGQVIEKAGVMFSHILIDTLPASASERYPQLAGANAEAMGVSVVVHPKNPHVPTSHMNVRFFVAYPQDSQAQPVWWFGGGFDLTPFYPTEQDCVAWHQNCFDLCQPFGTDVYPTFKQWCDDYFYLKHREEQRGIGGLFFDNVNMATEVGNNWSFERCFDFMQAVGHGYLEGVLPLFIHHKNTAYTTEQRDFQLYRRGRYVEFNLIYDRGTLFGLQSGGRIESILVSLPSLVSWHYNKTFVDNSQEYQLTDYYLKPRDWL